MNMKFAQIKNLAPALVILALVPAAALADTPGMHPGYLHAISDLRAARSLIMRQDAPNVVGNEMAAVREIDACCNDLVRASINDGKNIYDQPPADAGLDFKGRLCKALDLLNNAH